MSYGIYIVDKETRKTICLPNKHQIAGGTFAVGGTNECYFNITYNYHPIFERLFGEHGIRSIYNRDISETRNEMFDAALWLRDDENDDYWACTEGNVKKALKSLIELTDCAMKEFPETEMIWVGD